MTAQAKISASHKNVYVALAAAQMEMGPLVKGSVNPAFRSKYADLADLVLAVRQPLNANGLTYFHQIATVDGDRMMRTLLVHGDSESCIECDVPLIVAKNDMQGMKSATTYAKRIGLESVTGVAPDDDDGNAAAKSPPVVEDRPAFDVAAATNRIKASLAKSESLDDLRARWTADAETIQRIKAEAPGFYGEIEAAKNARKAELEPRPSDSVTADEIPY